MVVQAAALVRRIPQYDREEQVVRDSMEVQVLQVQGTLLVVVAAQHHKVEMETHPQGNQVMEVLALRIS